MRPYQRDAWLALALHVHYYLVSLEKWSQAFIYSKYTQAYLVHAFSRPCVEVWHCLGTQGNVTSSFFSSTTMRKPILKTFGLWREVDCSAFELCLLVGLGWVREDRLKLRGQRDENSYLWKDGKSEIAGVLASSKVGDQGRCRTGGGKCKIAEEKELRDLCRYGSSCQNTKEWIVTVI